MRTAVPLSTAGGKISELFFQPINYSARYLSFKTPDDFSRREILMPSGLKIIDVSATFVQAKR